MASEKEGTFKVDGVELYTKTWLPEGPAKAKLVVIHGYSDHVGRYYDFFPSLARAGIAVYGFDQRGWGRSVKTVPQRGRTGPASRVIADAAAFIKTQLPSEVPVFLLGHSMGGGELAELGSTPQYEDMISSIRGLIFEAPLIAFTPQQEPGWLKVVSGRLVAKLMPRFQLVNQIPPEKVSRQSDVQESMRDDPLLHHTGTLEGLAGMLDRTEALASGKMKLSPKVRSIILLHGEADQVCCASKAKQWFDKQAVQDKQYVTYKDAYHQLHADPCSSEFFEGVTKWILERCDASNGSGTGNTDSAAGAEATTDGALAEPKL